MHWLDSVLIDMVYHLHEEGQHSAGELGSEEAWLNLDNGTRRGQFGVIPRYWSHDILFHGVCTLLALQPYGTDIGRVEFGLEFGLTFTGHRGFPFEKLPSPEELGGFAHEVGVRRSSVVGCPVTMISVQATWTTMVSDREELDEFYPHWLMHADFLVTVMSKIAQQLREEG